MAQSAFYHIDDAKLAEVVGALTGRLVVVDARRIADYILADWQEGDEHQSWLNAAPAAEIAAWVPDENAIPQEEDDGRERIQPGDYRYYAPQ